MRKLSRCILRQNPERVLDPCLLIKFLALFAVVAGLGVAQIHLRFRARDMKIESRKLQSRSKDLCERRGELVAEVERLKRFDPESRSSALEELGLRECPPERSTRAAVSAESVARWERLRLASLPPEKRTLSRTRALAELAERLFAWSTPSLARQTAQ